MGANPLRGRLGERDLASGTCQCLALAFEFLVLVAGRLSEARIARWAEIERNAADRTVPAQRINAGREHRMPLLDRALGVLDEAHQLADNAGR